MLRAAPALGGFFHAEPLRQRSKAEPHHRVPAAPIPAAVDPAGAPGLRGPSRTAAPTGPSPTESLGLDRTSQSAQKSWLIVESAMVLASLGHRRVNGERFMSRQWGSAVPEGSIQLSSWTECLRSSAADDRARAPEHDPVTAALGGWTISCMLASGRSGNSLPFTRSHGQREWYREQWTQKHDPINCAKRPTRCSARASSSSAPSAPISAAAAPSPTIDGVLEATWPNTLALARMGDEMEFEALVPVGRWKGFGGVTNFNGAGLRVVFVGVGIGASTRYPGCSPPRMCRPCIRSWPPSRP